MKLRYYYKKLKIKGIRLRCFYCGKFLSVLTGTLDHVVAKKYGGSNDLDNLVPACKPCNMGKGCEPGYCVYPVIISKLKIEKPKETKPRVRKEVRKSWSKLLREFLNEPRPNSPIYWNH